MDRQERRKEKEVWKLKEDAKKKYVHYCNPSSIFYYNNETEEEEVKLAYVRSTRTNQW